MNSKPIACTLSAKDQSDRGDEWRRFLGADVVEVIRSGHSARLQLADADDAIMRAVDLARREKTCCAFFEFNLELLSEEVWLRIETPPEASTILDSLIAAT